MLTHRHLYRAIYVYLTQDEIALLLSKLDGDNKKIAILCLSKGARRSEAARLKAENVIHNRCTFVKTKTNKPRTVPISEEVAELVAGNKRGFLFPDANYPAFRRLMKELQPDLPAGQATHALRHSFATHFMINGGSIITLQRILGHSRIEQTMVYSHFAPEYLQDAITLNPLRGGVNTDSVHTVVIYSGFQWVCVPLKPALHR